ncbi:hypothetical protein OG413_10330 [Streptomyces sp. NBC_01433]|uniref:hypothetical protein n=1 Tax=Streptomyces sp. NBC_01433 TaxID=2903864 RepID=UPI002255C958|nr:hypothetical protein [Streptomyces sp. NBC_01433]MCX4675697.1 hypothetical protein [Streptomyces sp. NBC_01433]
MVTPEEVETAETATALAQAPEKPGNLTRLKLSPLGNRPYKCPEVIPAWWKLRSTHSSVSGLFDTLHLVRRERSQQNKAETRGRLHSDAQDLLRAAIVFTSAGVDASVQALIEHAVPELITRPGTPRDKYETFVEEQARAPKVEDSFLAALKSQDPRPELLSLYVQSKTKASFQGSGDLRTRAASSLGITNQQVPKGRFTSLDVFFTARNDVAHRLDMDDVTRADAAPPRKPRVQEEVRSMCDEALLLVRDLIKETAVNLAACR